MTGPLRFAVMGGVVIRPFRLMSYRRYEVEAIASGCQHKDQRPGSLNPFLHQLSYLGHKRGFKYFERRHGNRRIF